MKRAAICAFIMIVMISAGIILDLRTLSVTAELSAGLKDLEAAAYELSPEEKRGTAEKLSGKWESFCAGNIFLTNNEGASGISESLARIISASASDSSRFAEECRIAAQLVRLYNGSRSFTPGNIF